MLGERFSEREFCDLVSDENVKGDEGMPLPTADGCPGRRLFEVLCDEDARWNIDGSVMSRRFDGLSTSIEARPMPKAASGSEKTLRAAFRESRRPMLRGGVGVDFCEEGPSESSSCNENDLRGARSAGVCWSRLAGVGCCTGNGLSLIESKGKASRYAEPGRLGKKMLSSSGSYLSSTSIDEVRIDFAVMSVGKQPSSGIILFILRDSRAARFGTAPGFEILTEKNCRHLPDPSRAFRLI